MLNTIGSLDELDKILFYFPFELNPECTLKHLGNSMSGSRKQFDSNSRGFTGLLVPICWNFHDFSNWVPLPHGNSISINNKT